MTRPRYEIREIRKEDNPLIAQIIRQTLVEYGLPKVGTVYEDKSLDTLYDYYASDRSCYFVVELAGKVVGGAGISQLDNYRGPICELQKMYFNPEARGLGLGKILIEYCLEKAAELGYEQCYLETMPYMKEARKLYRKVGFEDLDKPVGDTGHYACSRWMIKPLP